MLTVVASPAIAHDQMITNDNNWARVLFDIDHRTITVHDGQCNGQSTWQESTTNCTGTQLWGTLGDENGYSFGDNP